MTEWKSANFGRRRYTVEGEELDKARSIRVVVYMDGKALIDVNAREPGVVAMVSKPDDQGFDIEILEPKVAYTDIRQPPAEAAPLDWQLEAIGVK